MIGSLGQFMQVQQDSIFPDNYQQEQVEVILPSVTKRRGKSAFETYVPDDKTDMLVLYQRNNIYNINRRKYNEIAKQAHTKQRIRKPVVEHHSFFVKPQVTKDYIAKQELKRKHNLLRAILRMKQNQEQPNKESDYQQSFNRLYKGFKNIHPQPILHKKQDKKQEQIIPPPKKILIESTRQKSSINNRKRLEYEHCLSWARKHNKNGDYFADQLGKNRKIISRQKSLPNRSLIDEIGKKVGTGINE